MREGTEGSSNRDTETQKSERKKTPVPWCLVGKVPGALPTLGVEMNPDPAIRLLRELVAINSVNPTLVAGAPGEEQIASAIADEMRRAGLDVSVETVVPRRPNVIGVLEGRAKGRALMLCGHTDT